MDTNFNKKRWATELGWGGSREGWWKKETEGAIIEAFDTLVGREFAEKEAIDFITALLRAMHAEYWG